MGLIETGEIIGYQHEGRLYCSECWRLVMEQELGAGDMSPDNYLTKDDGRDGDGVLYCDNPDCPTKGGCVLWDPKLSS